VLTSTAIFKVLFPAVIEFWKQARSTSIPTTHYFLWAEKHVYTQ